MTYLEIIKELKETNAKFNKIKNFCKKNKYSVFRNRFMLEKYSKFVDRQEISHLRERIKELKQKKEKIRGMFNSAKIVFYVNYLKENNAEKLPILFDDYQASSLYDFAKKILEGYEWGTNGKFNPDNEFIIENKELGIICSLSKSFLLDYYKACVKTADILQYISENKYYNI